MTPNCTVIINPIIKNVILQEFNFNVSIKISDSGSFDLKTRGIDFHIKIEIGKWQILFI